MFHLLGKILLFTVKWLVTFPMVTFIGLTDTISGERRWRTAEIRRMSDERPPMTDQIFTVQLQLPEDKTAVALAIRQAFATHAGVPSTAIHPNDQVAILLRMMSPWAGEIDIIFDVEYHLKVKIPIDRFCRLRGPQKQESVGQFVAAATLVAEQKKPVLLPESEA
jgi:hypothetical protein